MHKLEADAKRNKKKIRIQHHPKEIQGIYEMIQAVKWKHNLQAEDKAFISQLHGCIESVRAKICELSQRPN